MRRIAVALLAGLVVYALLQPWGGCDDFETSRCIGLLRWAVPTDAWVSLAAGAVTAAVVFLALWFRASRPDPNG